MRMSGLAGTEHLPCHKEKRRKPFLEFRLDTREDVEFASNQSMNPIDGL